VIVVDADILAFLVIPGKHTEAARSLLAAGEECVAPVLWRSELRNVLVGYMRRGELLLGEAVALLREAKGAMSEREFEMDSPGIMDLASRSGCSAYDCEYVALAKQLGVKLVTMDREVLRAFPEVAVPLVAG
jgi:predicted nucleic acid-binding protein